jgi:hypothetical protein
MKYLGLYSAKEGFFVMSKTGVYGAASWKEVKCNKLVVSLSGDQLHHLVCHMDCFIILTNSQ